MFGAVLALTMPLALVAAVRLTVAPEERSRVTALLLAGYAARILLSFFVRDLPLFSHGVGVGDSFGYEEAATTISKLWEFNHHPFYVTADDFPDLQETTLPANLFGLVFFLNGGASQVGCTSIIAVLACLTCLNLYCLSVDLGARHDIRFAMTAVVMFLPSFLFYTSEMYKDGLVAFFVIGVLGSALRLARRFAFLDVALAAVCIAGLWLTRYYLVFAMLAPLALGLVGFRSQSWLRQVVAVLAGAAAVAAAVYFMKDIEQFHGTATNALERVTSTSYEQDISASGSGVEINESSPVGSLLLKVLYTVFAPFPWQSGSLGLQLTKGECLLWYFALARAALGVKYMWRHAKSELAVLISFIVPLTLAYAMSFANVGLIVRLRIPIVMAVMLLATLSWSERPAPARSASPEFA